MKKKTMYIISLLLLMSILSLLVITGCRKDEQPTQTDLLCNNWKIVHTYVEVQSVLTEFNIGFEMTLKFTADKQAVFSSNNQTETAIWSWDIGEKSLSFQTSSGQLNWEVKKLTDNEFWYRFLSGSGNYCVYKCVKKE